MTQVSVHCKVSTCRALVFPTRSEREIKHGYILCSACRAARVELLCGATRSADRPGRLPSLSDVSSLKLPEAGHTSSPAIFWQAWKV